MTEGKEVFVIDDLSTGSLANIAHLRDNPNFHLTKGSILNSADLEPLVDQVDFIYHFAAAVGVELVVRVIPDPHKDIGFNILSLFHYRRRVRIVTCPTLEEAMKALEG